MSLVSEAKLLDALDEAPNEIEQVMAVLRSTGHDPLELSLGTGDRLLLALAEELTNQPIELTVDCPACGEMSMISISASEVAEHSPRTGLLGPGQGVREPTYQDLLELPAGDEQAVRTLGRRCYIGPAVSDVDLEPDVDFDPDIDLVPDIDLDAVLAALDEVDGSLAGPLEAACFECGSPILVEADMQRLALRRLRLYAEAIDRDVHLLASVYGWELATIQALPVARRRRLVQLIEAGRS
ncbi:MAG: hypothetical protein ACRBK7_17480 [Acidimicrobiales bacterium]